MYTQMSGGILTQISHVVTSGKWNFKTFLLSSIYFIVCLNFSMSISYSDNKNNNKANFFVSKKRGKRKNYSIKGKIQYTVLMGSTEF